MTSDQRAQDAGRRTQDQSGNAIAQTIMNAPAKTQDAGRRTQDDRLYTEKNPV